MVLKVNSFLNGGLDPPCKLLDGKKNSAMTKLLLSKTFPLVVHSLGYQL